MSDPFLGEIKIVGFNFAPQGWAKCDGQLLSISSNSALFSLYGTMYGGDGRTTFGLPDLRGRFPMHVGNGPGLPNRIQGTKQGDFEKQLTIGNMPAHNHSVIMQCNSEEGNSDDPADAYPAVDQVDQYSSIQNESMAPSTCSNAGGNQAFDIMNPFQVLNFVVALVGIYPST